MGGKEQNLFIYIFRIIQDGVVDRYGGLKRGDQLFLVNGVVSILSRVYIYFECDNGNKKKYTKFFYIEGFMYYVIIY